MRIYVEPESKYDRIVGEDAGVLEMCRESKFVFVPESDADHMLLREFAVGVVNAEDRDRIQIRTIVEWR